MVQSHLLTHFDIDRLRRLVVGGQILPSGFRYPGIELGAALELVAALTLEDGSALRSVLDVWSREDERLAGAMRAFAGVSSDAALFSGVRAHSPNRAAVRPSHTTSEGTSAAFPISLTLRHPVERPLFEAIVHGAG